MRVVHFHQIRRLAPQPAADSHSRQALGYELQFAAFFRCVMHANHGAVLGQAVRVEAGRILRRRVHKEEGQALMRRFGDQVQGFGPGLFVDNDRQHLGREERPVVDRDDVQLVGLLLVRQHQPGR